MPAQIAVGGTLRQELRRWATTHRIPIMERRFADFRERVLPGPDCAIWRKLRRELRSGSRSAEPLRDSATSRIPIALLFSGKRRGDCTDSCPSVAIGGIEDVMQILATELPLAVLFYRGVLVHPADP